MEEIVEKTETKETKEKEKEEWLQEHFRKKLDFLLYLEKELKKRKRRKMVQKLITQDANIEDILRKCRIDLFVADVTVFWKGRYKSNYQLTDEEDRRYYAWFKDDIKYLISKILGYEFEWMTMPKKKWPED